MVWVANDGVLSVSQLAGINTHSLKKTTGLHVDSSASVNHGISLLLAVPHLLVLGDFP
jgi:hypothetical protein